ncbi:hypothetical protein RN001_002286 [Aquatica leii]|uniref:Uncharacterized protein n=1 Tax=Aquatica leii TaxID=1421715 RepID=A0AAN7PD74_9COLE|nr:hypothetical protein RN001_002286 [Aquatica leii]
MCSTWIEKEEEYRKLNEELQKRNKMLMEEFEIVLKNQDNFLQESKEAQIASKFEKNSLVQNKIKYFNSNAKENLPNEKIEVFDVPDSVDEMGVKGMARFYRAKIKAMQNGESKLQLELKAKMDEISKLQKENTKLLESKEKWFQAYNINKATINKLENQITGLNSKYQSKESENASLKKDIEQIKKDFKNTNLCITGSEVRLNRALEENEKIKNLLKNANQKEKDLTDDHKKEINELTGVIKQLDKQKCELFSAFKKQMQLIDNLKRQKLHLEALKLNQISENEFIKILDWKIDV